MQRTSGLTRSANRFPSRPLYPLLGKLTQFNGSQSNVKFKNQTNSKEDPTHCVHVDDCVVALNGNFQTNMLPIAKCGLCNASPFEKSLWACLMPGCFFVGCADADHGEKDHSAVHRLQHPTHLIQMNLQSGNVLCEKCKTTVDISSKLTTPGEFRPNLKLLASLKLGQKDESLVEEIIQACVGSDDGRRFSAHKFLREHDDLHHVFPRLLKFCVSGMNLQSDNLQKVFVVMQMLRSLLNNKSLSSVLPKYAHEVFPPVGRCIVSNTLPLGEHWALRGFASRILADICRGNEFLAKKLANNFSEIFSHEKPALVSFYGVIRGLHELGPEFVKELVLPHVGYISKKIDESSIKSELERKVADRTRNALIRAVAPVLKTLKNPPDLTKFGTLGPHFQQVAPPSIGGFQDGRGLAQTRGRGDESVTGMPGIWRLTKAPMPVTSDAVVRQSSTQVSLPSKRAKGDSEPILQGNRRTEPGSLQVHGRHARQQRQPREQSQGGGQRGGAGGPHPEGGGAPRAASRRAEAVPAGQREADGSAREPEIQGPPQHLQRQGRQEEQGQAGVGGGLRGSHQESSGHQSFQSQPWTKKSNVQQTKPQQTALGNKTTQPTTAQSLAKERPIDVSSIQNNASPTTSQSVAEERPIVDSSIPNNASPLTPLHNRVDPGVEAELHVYGLKYWVTEEMIWSNFSEFGVILDIFLSKVGYCHIKYSTREEAAACMEALNGKIILTKKLQIEWAKTSKFKENSIYYLFCEKYNICYKFNIEEDGCETANCPRRHCCLFCYELFRKEEDHRSKFECPNQKPGFVRFPPRAKRPRSPQTDLDPDGDKLQQSSSSGQTKQKFKFSKK